jgi:UDP-glucose 4-epimerase
VSATIAVTGASGYLGSRLLATAAVPAIGIVRKPVSYLPADRQVAIDLTTEGPGLPDAFEGVATVVHLAGHNEVVASQEPDRAMAETLASTRHVTAAAVAAGVQRLVYVSTVHVYGSNMQPGTHLDETTTPSPTSPYAIARLASEHLIAEAGAAGIDVVVFRLTNAVGAPADVAVNRWTLVATDLCRQAVRTGTLELRSSGQQWRDFVALADVCDAVGLAADPAGELAPGTYNLGTGESHTILDLAALVQDSIERRTGTRPPLRTAPQEPDPPAAYTVGVQRLGDAGWRSRTSLTEAVDELAAFCLDHEGELR